VTLSQTPPPVATCPSATPPLPLLDLSEKLIVLGVTGSIAAYKAAILARTLVKAGASVQVILTERAREFVGSATFAGITGRPPACGMFDPNAGGESHVSLTARADLIVVAPATADVLARLAQGRADDLLTATALCARQTIVIAPAMHPAMWLHPATQRNVEQLKQDGRVRFVGPECGEVASGDQGRGRMSDPERIADYIGSLLTDRDLAGRHVVVTAGPTVEDLDPVRYLTNRSSGKMGFQLAARAARRGAKVTLVAGPVALQSPEGVTHVRVRGALEMQRALDDVLGTDLTGADALIMAAAVADYRVAEVSGTKLKRHAETMNLSLLKNPDLLQTLSQRRQGTRISLIGFAVETADDAAMVDFARDKLRRKRVDMVVANHASESLGADTNRVWLVTETDARPIPTAAKSVVADRILDWLSQSFSGASDR
jgi:phosphopantothenoylcysteine decarboxylase / phosphopantothenate---cysteine ligase